LDGSEQSAGLAADFIILDELDAKGLLRGKRKLTLDRDTKFTAAFDCTLWASGTQVVVTPYRAPNSGANVKRFVSSITSECTGNTVLFGETMLGRALNQFIRHCNTV
jgi:putative transposase